MRIYNMLKLISISIFLLFGLVSFFGCGISISQESARSAVENAKVAVMDAKDADAGVHSPKNMKAAERFMDEAEQALSHNHRQRAYTLAGKAEKAAKAAEEEVKKKTEVVSTASQPVTTVPGKEQSVRQPAGIPSNIIVPPAEQPETQILGKSMPEPLYMPSSQTADMQNRIQAAVQALEAAQKAVESAKSLVFKMQIDIELSKMDVNIRQMQDANVPVDTINLVRLWYGQAQQAALAGYYDNSMRLIQRIQMYVQAFTTPIQY